MARLKEGEARFQLLEIVPHDDHYQPGKVKVRVYEMDHLINLMVANYNQGYTDGKNQTRKAVKKLMQKL